MTQPPDFVPPVPVTAEEYDKLTPGERAVLVAKDVLARLGQYRLCKGSYLSPIKVTPPEVVEVINDRYKAARLAAGKTDELYHKYLEDDVPFDLQPFADTLMKTCQVCLLGACFLSKARVLDRCPARYAIDLRGHVSDPNVYSRLEDVFDTRTAAMMESAFEMSIVFANRSEVGHDDARNAALFGIHDHGCSYHPADERVRMVMENVVANGGKFVPPEAYFVKQSNETGLFQQSEIDRVTKFYTWGPPDPATVKKYHFDTVEDGTYGSTTARFFRSKEVTEWKPKAAAE